jgi:hypothetical protein
LTINSVINDYQNTLEQSLHADLIEEAIQTYGQDVYYIPRTLRNFDDLYNQDDMSSFNAAYPLEMYLKNVDSFEGDGSFMSKFGLEVQDRITLSVSIRRFMSVVGTPHNLLRPREGDLLYFPMILKLFEINYADSRAQFFPQGALPMYDLQAEVFEYNGEVFATGITAIDNIAAGLTIDRRTEPRLNGNNQVIFDTSGGPEALFNEFDRDIEFDNNFLEAQANGTIDLSEFDPFTTG